MLGNHLFYGEIFWQKNEAGFDFRVKLAPTELIQTDQTWIRPATYTLHSCNKFLKDPLNSCRDKTCAQADTPCPLCVDVMHFVKNS